MTFRRGDVALARFPHVAGTRGKKRPVVIVQSDAYNRQARHCIVAEVTSNMAAAADPAFLPIDISTTDGAVTGLSQNSVVGCLFLATVAEHRLSPAIGRLSAEMVNRLNACLKAAMQIP